MTLRTKSFVAVFGLLSLMLHWAWEVAHGPTYVETAALPVIDRVLHCAPMALVDSVWTAILVIVALSMSQALGRTTPTAGAGTTAVLGALTATVFELWALRNGRWTYNDLMPRIPFVGVGFWPVLQMTVLPPAVYLLAAVATARTARRARRRGLPGR